MGKTPKEKNNHTFLLFSQTVNKSISSSPRTNKIATEITTLIIVSSLKRRKTTQEKILLSETESARKLDQKTRNTF